MIFVSSCCIRHPRIDDSIRELAAAGFRNIELTGGSSRYAGFIEDLLRLRQELGLRYTVHNYFPPPKEHFVLNLASLNPSMWQRSVDHCREALSLCRRLDISFYGVHAGFLLDIKTDEAGKRIPPRKIEDRAAGLQRFAEAFATLRDEYPDVELYIENNVFSAANAESLGGNAFLMTDVEGYQELRAACPECDSCSTSLTSRSAVTHRATTSPSKLISCSPSPTTCTSATTTARQTPTTGCWRPTAGCWRCSTAPFEASALLARSTRVWMSFAPPSRR